MPVLTKEWPFACRLTIYYHPLVVRLRQLAMTTASIHRAEAPDPSVAQKRRRRAPASGAAEDCHSCRKRQTPCDRRRPYCSQCVELGKECSGYKTTLTWGVGVASRGKLRGMTLPVALPPPTSPVEEPPKSTGERTSGEGPRPRKRTKSTSYVPPSEAPQYPASYSYPSYPSIDMPNSSSWKSIPYSNQSPLIHTPAQHPKQHSCPSISSMLGSPTIDTAISSSADSVHSAMSLASYRDQRFEYFPRQSSPPDEHNYHGSVPIPFSSNRVRHYQEPASPIVFTPVEMPQPYHHQWPSSAPQASPVPGTTYDQAANFSFSPPQTDWTLPSPAYGNSQNAFSLREEPLPTVLEAVDEPTEADDEAGSRLENAVPDYSLSIPRELTLTHSSPRTRSLIDYYDKAICPVLVAFDGPSNPYRMHVLPLAFQNDGLQNALAALATNNLRMRRLKNIPSFRSTPDQTTREIASSIGRPSAEEQKYKAASIELLNSQLANAWQASDDAVLATLLILCLFHVCDTGFSKFKTQLAGVQKLLRLRGRRLRSDFVGWVEMFFAWFGKGMTPSAPDDRISNFRNLDVMTSAVNDRETEIQGDSLDLFNFASDLGALEQFSGCDGRLFKIIARLGRLNVLSQGKPVREMPESKSIRAAPTDYYSLGSHQASTSDSSYAQPGIRNERLQFSREWTDIRQRLHAWEMNSTGSPAATAGNLTGQSDLMHISESFRYSALLYTERLARPDVPSADPNIQAFVDKSIFHIQAIGPTSCVLKFMLWPIFITGTECINEEYRSMIRRTCIDIQQESGFYNNVSGLEVLERVWKDMDAGAPADPSDPQVFRWRQAMKRADGEYIVI